MRRRIENYFQTFYPFAPERCRQRTNRLMCFGILPLLCAAVYGSMNLCSVWTVILMVWIILFLEAELLGILFCTEEERMYSEISRLTARIRHQYYCFENVTDAVYFAAEGMEKPVRLHLQKIYQVLTAEQTQAAENEYYEKVKNPLYRMLFLQLCLTAEYGDEEGAEGSFLLNHLHLLQQEADLMIRNQKRLRHLCSGLGAVTAIPVLCMNWIEIWAVDNLPELFGFYHGWQGGMVRGAGLLITVLVYILLFNVRWFRRRGREEEMQRFYFVIRMLRNMPGMSVQELLLQLEENSKVFQKQLRQCLREMEWNEREAFEKLREAVDYQPMKRIADLFVLTEEAGVAEAFGKMETEMREFAENRTLEQEILQSRQVEIGTIAACIPGIFILTFYLIVPFLTECFGQLDMYMKNLGV